MVNGYTLFVIYIDIKFKLKHMKNSISDILKRLNDMRNFTHPIKTYFKCTVYLLYQ